MNNQNYQNNQKGVSLYIAIILLSILLGASLGLSSLLVTKIKMIRGMEESVVAFFAADTGIEKALTEKEDPKTAFPDGYSETFNLGGGGEVSYELTVWDNGDDECDASNFCIKSVGSYKDTKRAIEVRY